MLLKLNNVPTDIPVGYNHSRIDMAENRLPGLAGNFDYVGGKPLQPLFSLAYLVNDRTGETRGMSVQLAGLLRCKFTSLLIVVHVKLL